MLLMEIKNPKDNAACMQCRNTFNVTPAEIKGSSLYCCPYCEHINKMDDALEHYDIIISESPEVVAFADALAKRIKQRTSWETAVSDDGSVVITIEGNDVFKYSPQGGILNRHNPDIGDWKQVGYDFYNTSDLIKRIYSELQ